MAGLSTNAPGLWGGFAGLLYGSTSLSTPPGFLADATPAWVLPGSALDLDFADSLGYNSLNLATTTPDSILTYTAPSAKLVYGSDGVLGYAPHNRWLQSQTFDNASWIKNSGSISAEKATAPDGTITANKFIEAAATTVHYLQQNFDAAGQTINVSFYAKVAEREIVYIRFTNSAAASAYVWFNVSTGAVLTTNAGITAPPPTNAGNGFYRCSASIATVNGVGTFGIGISNADGVASYAGDGTSGIYVWGAQYSLGSSALTYIPTTTAAVYSLPIDHNPTTFAPLGVLIEEQRTNLLTYSEQFDNADWAKTGTSISATSTAAPDANPTADTLKAGVTTGFHQVVQAKGVADGAVVCCSVFIKYSNHPFITISASDNVVRNYAVLVNVQTGSIIGNQTGFSGYTAPLSSSIQPVGGGWYRVSVVADLDTGRTNANIGVTLAENGNVASSGSWTTTGTEEVFIWGAQLEAGAFPTSYVPTTNNPLGVTRLADKVSILTSAFAYSATAGTIAVDVTLGQGGGGLALFNDGTADNQISTGAAPGNGFSGFFVKAATVVQADIFAGSTASTGAHKQAAAWQANDFTYYTAGVQRGTPDTSGSIPTVTKLNVGLDRTSYLGGHIKRLTYFPTRRTDADLQVLTRGDDLVWGAGDYLVWGSGNNLTW